LYCSALAKYTAFLKWYFWGKTPPSGGGRFATGDGRFAPEASLVLFSCKDNESTGIYAI